LRRYADIIGVETKSAQTVAAVKNALRELADADLVLIDTHGVSGKDRGHYTRLAAILRAARPDEVHLVLPASMHAAVQTRVAERFKPLGVSRVVLTHLDEAVGLGVLLNAIGRLEWGLSYLSDGETVPNHLSEACPVRVADLAFPAPVKAPAS
jgi:flagellar biosynthesis protein FlhF